MIANGKTFDCFPASSTDVGLPSAQKTELLAQAQL
jgi:hypothetical protein